MRIDHAKIGLLLPTTGVDSAQGTDTTKGLELYLGKIGYSECGWDAAALIITALDALNGDLSDRNAVRDALKSALPKIKPPRGLT